MRRVAAAIILLLMMGSLAGAVEPVVLPGFQVTSVDGSAVKSADLRGKGSWLLIYVQSRSQFSDSLLSVLKREQYPNLAQNAVIIIGGSVDELRIMRSKYPDLDQAAWYADPTKDAFTQLKLHGIPVVLGIKERTIAWSLNGVLADAKISKSILNTWLQQPQRPE